MWSDQHECFMPPEINEFDRVRLLHMLEAAKQATAFAEGRNRQSLDQDVMLRCAVLHCIQEIGEAATRVAPETRAFTPSLPWNQIVGMRHRLVHVYFAVDLDLVWEVVQRDLPLLVAALCEILPEEHRS